jgi:hypothetical protein
VQVIVFANHFQKHSDLQAIAAKPLIDHGLPAAYNKSQRSVPHRN